MRLSRKGKATALVAAGLMVVGLLVRAPLAVATSVFLWTALVVAALSVRESRLSGRRTMSRNQLGENTPLTVQLEVTNHGRRAVHLEVRDPLPGQARLIEGNNHAFLRLTPRETAENRFRSAIVTRGYRRIGPAVARLSDAFGLVHEEQELAPAEWVLVEPAIEPLKDLPARSSLARVNIGSHITRRPGDGFEFYSIRPYAPGDSPRNVNWKASARSSEILVNQRSHESHAEVTIFLDARENTEVGIERYTPLTQGTRAVATMTAFLGRRRDITQVCICGADVRVLRPGTTRSKLAELLETLALLQPEGSLPLGHAINELMPSLKPKSPVVVVSSLEDDATIEDALKRLVSLGNSVLVISPGPTGLDDDSDVEQEYSRDRRDRIRRVRGYGATVLDWRAGELLSTALAVEAH